MQNQSFFLGSNRKTPHRFRQKIEIKEIQIKMKHTGFTGTFQKYKNMQACTGMYTGITEPVGPGTSWG